MRKGTAQDVAFSNAMLLLQCRLQLVIALTGYAAGGFVAGDGADYAVRGGTLGGVTAAPGVILTRFVWRERIGIDLATKKRENQGK